jgi:hypothetical protein
MDNLSAPKSESTTRRYLVFSVAVVLSVFIYQYFYGLREISPGIWCDRLRCVVPSFSQEEEKKICVGVDIGGRFVVDCQ